ncbi:unnamed protein product [Linum tenue]|nr:unnamed protein product [Linum tenue]
MPPSCTRDVDCTWYCIRIQQGIALCNNQRSCICLPKVHHRPHFIYTPQPSSPLPSP